MADFACKLLYRIKIVNAENFPCYARETKVWKEFTRELSRNTGSDFAREPTGNDILTVRFGNFPVHFYQLCQIEMLEGWDWQINLKVSFLNH